MLNLPTGDLVRYQIARTCIKSQKRFTYKEALAVIEKQKKSPHEPLLDRMVDLCHVLKKKRYERGSIDFAMPDDVIIVDEKGVPLRIERVEYDITHQMIEEFMLKANELTAQPLPIKAKLSFTASMNHPLLNPSKIFTLSLARSGSHYQRRQPTWTSRRCSKMQRVSPFSRNYQLVSSEACGSLPILPITLATMAWL